MKQLFRQLFKVPYVVLWNIFLVLVCYMVCRVVFLLENWSLFEMDMTWENALCLFQGGLLFDGSAIAYMNLLYVAMSVFPFHLKETDVWQAITKWTYVVPNAFGIIANLADSVYYPYNRQRATAVVFDEFQNESNLLRIVVVEFQNHWYLVVLAVVLIFGLYRLYLPASVWDRRQPLWRYYVRYLCSFALLSVLAVCAMRGKYLDTQSRPIAVNDAHTYVTSPQQTAIVLNTPFAVLRTLCEKPMQLPVYFSDQSELDSIYSPLHLSRPDRVERHKNVCILIVESYAQEFIGSRTRELDSGMYRGYAPFADELMEKSLTWRETFCNGGISIDAMPAVLASIPRMDRPYVLQPYSLNTINSIATELKHWGYQSTFFHGAPNGSMGFQAFAKCAGFDEYVGMTEYCNDGHFNGMKDFDGTWAIWDEPFLQFCLERMNGMRQPFFTTVFTASSHHPFHIPEQYRDTFPDEGQYSIHKCIRYTDHSLRRFFEKASRQPWYKNTIFVLTADHASGRVTHDEYKTMVGIYRVPLLFFDPSGEMPVGCMDGIAQHIDIMPTLLGYLGYDQSYMAFGQDLLHTDVQDMWAFSWSHIPQYVQGDYALLFNGKEVTGFYDYRHDVLMKMNLHGKKQEEPEMEQRVKALLQSYTERMKKNDVTVKTDKKK